MQFPQAFQQQSLCLYVLKEDNPTSCLVLTTVVPTTLKTSNKLVTSSHQYSTINILPNSNLHTRIRVSNMNTSSV